ncbi:DUF6855 family protein [Archangium sp.]|uniref:RCC1 domain-containing protein n=1 Tax=Archangium sp. TaxID=1872627 RepID=UPI00286AE3EC|nr:hypothetical protein [Archangium sp.]
MAAKKTAAKNAPAKKTVVKKAPAKKTAVKKAPAKQQARSSSSGGTREQPWMLKTPPGTSEFEAFRDDTLDPPALVVRVGKTELRYQLRCIDDLHALLVAHGDWMPQVMRKQAFALPQGAWAALMCTLMAVACGQPEVGRWGGEEQSLPGQGTVSAALTVMASYDWALRVPRCTGAASGCDSGGLLLKGRGSVGPEANAPNTLGGTCADGTAGAYHSDESVDRVKVYTTDGTALASGKQVTLEVDVWAWSGYASDALDLYSAADASSPTWNYLTTLVPTGPGAQTLRVNYTLPAGASTQAVRAAFRYSGSASTCTTGGYDDRDDLAFAVDVPQPQPSKVAAGYFHALRVNADGTVSAWGNNSQGQLGDGSTTQRHAPVQVVGLTNVESITAGDHHSLALKRDGTVWTWGANSSGQLGDGTTTQRTTPVQVVGLTQVVAISARNAHSLAVKQDGTVWAWGNNDNGQLGDGSTFSHATPWQVSGLSGVAIVAAGWWTSLAVKQDGTVWAWGNNDKGQLGNGTTTSSTTPVRVPGLSMAKDLVAGRMHVLALKQDGTVWAWGYNDKGQLGDGTPFTRLTPVQVSGLTGVTSLGANISNSIAARNDGTVWTWGDNFEGQLGNGTTTWRNTPGQVPGLSGATAVRSGSTHSVALKQDGSIWAWGDNAYGQLGDGTLTDRYSPVSVLP